MGFPWLYPSISASLQSFCFVTFRSIFTNIRLYETGNKTSTFRQGLWLWFLSCRQRFNSESLRCALIHTLRACVHAQIRTCQNVIAHLAPVLSYYWSTEDSIDFPVSLFCVFTFVCPVRYGVANRLLTALCIHLTFTLIGWTVFTHLDCTTDLWMWGENIEQRIRITQSRKNLRWYFKQWRQFLLVIWCVWTGKLTPVHSAMMLFQLHLKTKSFAT